MPVKKAHTTKPKTPAALASRQAAAAKARAAKAAKPPKPKQPRTEPTEKEKVFIAEYFARNCNATHACAAAYGYDLEDPKQYSAAKNHAYQLMHMPEYKRVQDAVARIREERIQRLEITAEDVLRELAKIGFANMEDYITVNEAGDSVLNLSKVSRQQAAAIQELVVETYTEKDATGRPRTVKRTRFKLGDKKGALDLLGRNYKLFTDKVENTLQNPDGTALSSAPPVLQINFVEAKDGKPAD